MRNRKCRWREREPIVMSRPDPKPLPVGMPLEQTEKLARKVQCCVCGCDVWVTQTLFDAVRRLRLDWTLCPGCEGRADDSVDPLPWEDDKED